MGTATATKRIEKPVIEFCVGTKMGVVTVKGSNYVYHQEELKNLNIFDNEKLVATFREWDWIIEKEKMVPTSLA